MLGTCISENDKDFFPGYFFQATTLITPSKQVILPNLGERAQPSLWGISPFPSLATGLC